MYISDQAPSHEMDQALREKCGVVAIYSPVGDAMPDAYDAIAALQHRGQDGSGFAYRSELTSADSRIAVAKDLGLVAVGYANTIHPTTITGQQFAIAHVRYGTMETEDPYDALHPVKAEFQGLTITLAENGQLIMEPLRRLASEYGVNPKGTDAQMVTEILGQATEMYGGIEPAFSKVLPRLEGAFNLAVLTDEGLYVVTDRHHLRPFVIGRKDDAIMVASEVRALNAAGFEFQEETQTGTYAKIGPDGIEVTRWAEEDRKDCIFEHTYLSKSENIINGVHVGAYRQRIGRTMALLEAEDFNPDFVIPILGTAKNYAKGYSRALNVPYLATLQKNPNAQRTFIGETKALRAQAIAEKFSIPHPDQIEGKIITVVDDSLVRGATIRQIIKILKAANPAEIHVRIACAPVVDVCNYGVNITSKDELFVYDDEEIEGINSLTYVSLEDMVEATDRPMDSFCHGCLGGSYPVTHASHANELPVLA